MKLGPSSWLPLDGGTEVKPSCESSSLFRAGKEFISICAGCSMLLNVFTKVETVFFKSSVVSCRISAA